MAHERREQLVSSWMAAAIDIDSPWLRGRLIVDCDDVRPLQYLDWEQVAPGHHHCGRPGIALPGRDRGRKTSRLGGAPFREIRRCRVGSVAKLGDGITEADPDSPDVRN